MCKAGRTLETHDLDMKYIQITCLPRLLNHEVRIIQYKKKLTINKNKIEKLKDKNISRYLILQHRLFTWFYLMNLFIKINL